MYKKKVRNEKNFYNCKILYFTNTRQITYSLKFLLIKILVEAWVAVLLIKKKGKIIFIAKPN